MSHNNLHHFSNLTDLRLPHWVCPAVLASGSLTQNLLLSIFSIFVLSLENSQPAWALTPGTGKVQNKGRGLAHKEQGKVKRNNRTKTFPTFYLHFTVKSSLSWRKVNNICTCLWFQHVRHRYSSVHSHSRDMTIRKGLHRIQVYIRHRGYTHKGKRHSSSGENKGELVLRLPSSLNIQSYSIDHKFTASLRHAEASFHPHCHHSLCHCSGWWQLPAEVTNVTPQVAMGTPREWWALSHPGGYTGFSSRQICRSINSDPTQQHKKHSSTSGLSFLSLNLSAQGLLVFFFIFITGNSYYEHKQG